MKKQNYTGFIKEGYLQPAASSAGWNIWDKFDLTDSLEFCKSLSDQQSKETC